MKRIKIAILTILAISLIFSGCSNSDTDESSELSTVAVAEISSEDMFSDFDLDTSYDLDQVVEIDLTDGSETITSEGTYLISGDIENGQIIVDCADEDKVHIILSDVNISCDYSAPIYIINADKVAITLEDGTENTLSITGDISDNADGIDGVVYSKSDLTFNGTGALEVYSDYTNGIVGKDDVVLAGGNYDITAATDGIQANDSIRVINSTINIVSEKDGIQVQNDENTDKGFIYLEDSNITLDTGEDAINATNYIQIVSGSYIINSDTDGISTDTYLLIQDGTFDITTGGGYQGVLNIITVGEGSGGTVSETDKLDESMKAVKGNDIIIEGGTFNISSYEDGFNADNDITVSGGDITVNSGDEAFTAKNLLEINDGTIVVENGYEGFEGRYININGGDITIDVLDDGINGGESDSVVTIAGGTLTVICQGDGLDSNGELVISGGYITLDVSAIYTGGDGNIDAETVTYTGGTIVDAAGNEIDPTEQLSEGGRPPR